MQLKLRYYFRFITAFLGKFKFILLISMFVGILLFIGIQYFDKVKIGTNIGRIGYVGRYRAENLPEDIQIKLSGGLTKINENGDVEPNISTSWETTDKGKTWVFNIDKEAVWQDGVPIVSDDINYEFSDVVIDKPDHKTIIFNLEEEFTPFPYILSRPVFRKGLLGTGEWKVDDIIISNGYVQEVTIMNEVKEKIIYKFYPTEDEVKLAFKLGGVDSIEGLLDPAPLDKWVNTKIDKIIDTNDIVTLFFNTSDPLLSDKSFRQALVYAIDKESFEGERAISPISSKSWAYNPQVKNYTYDTERAKSLIENMPEEQKEAGIKLATTPSLLATAEKIASYWRSISIPTVVQVTSVVPDDYQVFLTIFELPKDPDQYSIWHSTQESTNISNYKSPRIDKLLEDGRTEILKETRRKTYLDFQRFLVEDSPAAFLFNPIIYTVSRD